MTTDTDIRTADAKRQKKKPESEVVKVGKPFGKYEVIKKIGSGGMGAVYLASDRDLKRTVALKILPPEKAENPTLVKRFKAEARSAAQLQHENIVSIYESGEADGLNYLALEYVDGIDVHKLIHRRERLSFKRSLEIVKQIASALNHAHEINIVHRDIKPSNLLITKEGVVKLTDMGLARSMDDETDTNITRAGTTVGTVDYMAPEQARSSKAADIRSDIYSLGCTWYHMLTGVPPYGEGSMTNKLHAHATAKLPDPRDINESVPEPIVAVLHKMMAKKPADRYQTPKELLEDLNNSNLRRTKMSNEGLSALAKEVSEESSRSKSKSDSSGPRKMPPKAERPVAVQGEGIGIGISPDLIKLLVAVVVVIGLSVFLWRTIAGFGDVVGDNAQTANPFDRNQNGEDGDNGTAVPNVKATKNDPEGDGIEIGTSNPAIPSIKSKPKPDKAVEAFTKRWQTIETLKTIPLANKPNAGSVDAEFLTAIKQLPDGGGMIQLNQSGLYVLTLPLEITGKRVVITAAPGVSPVVLLAPALKGNSAGSLEVLADEVLIRGIHFAVLGKQFNNARPLSFINQRGTGILEIHKCSFTLEGHHLGRISAVDLQDNVPHDSSNVLLMNCLVRGDGLTAISGDARRVNAAVRSSLIASGNAPAVRLESVEQKVKNTGSGSTYDREIDIRQSVLCATHSAIGIHHDGESQQPRTRITTDRTRIQRVSGAESAVMLNVENWQETSPHKPGSSKLKGLGWVTSESRFMGWDKLCAANTTNTKLHEATDRKQWEELLQTTVSAEFANSDRITPDDLMEFDWLRPGSLGSGIVGAAKKPEQVTGEFFGKLPVPPMMSIEREFVMSIRPSAPGALDDFSKAETIEIDVSRKDLGVELSKRKLPDKVIVKVVGAGVHKSSPIHIRNKSIRLNFVKKKEAEVFIIEPKTIPLGRLAKSEEKFVSLINIDNGIVEVRNGVFRIPAVKNQSTPNWFLQARNSAFLLDGVYATGPTTKDERHKGLINWVEHADEAPDKKRVAVVRNSYLMGMGTVFESLAHRRSGFFENSLMVSLTDVARLKLPQGDAKPTAMFNFNQCTFSAVEANLRIVSEKSKFDRYNPLSLHVESCLFAPALVTEKVSSPAAVIASPDAARTEALQWWASRNAYSVGVPAIFRSSPLSITQSKSGYSREWSKLWGYGHVEKSIFGARYVLMKVPKIRRQGLKPKDFELSYRCQAHKLGHKGQPVGAAVGRMRFVNLGGAAMNTNPQNNGDKKPVLPGF